MFPQTCEQYKAFYEKLYQTKTITPMRHWELTEMLKRQCSTNPSPSTKQCSQSTQRKAVSH